MPPNTIYVGRPSRFANCFDWQIRMKEHGENEHQAKIWATRSFRAVWEKYAAGAYKVYLDQLRGKDLACWCGPEQPCHADVLLDLANRR
jgi:Domain of unknown function (DUF4326)